MTEVTVRDAHLNDVDQITPLIGELGYPSSVEQVRRRLERLMASVHTRVMVAELDGTVAGLAVVEISHIIEHDRPICALRAIVTDERHRGRGIGATLIGAVEAEANAHQCLAVMLNSGNQRHGAHAFYERMGYQATGTRFVKWFSDRKGG
jgi:N-acetylglutamate synthase-like GNAT family acetyltransferase